MPSNSNETAAKPEYVYIPTVKGPIRATQEEYEGWFSHFAETAWPWPMKRVPTTPISTDRKASLGAILGGTMNDNLERKETEIILSLSDSHIRRLAAQGRLTEFSNSIQVKADVRILAYCKLRPRHFSFPGQPEIALVDSKGNIGNSGSFVLNWAAVEAYVENRDMLEAVEKARVEYIAEEEKRTAEDEARETERERQRAEREAARKLLADEIMSLNARADSLHEQLEDERRKSESYEARARNYEESIRQLVGFLEEKELSDEYTQRLRKESVESIYTLLNIEEPEDAD